MIRTVPDMLIAFDCEWIPDVQSARLLFREAEGLPEDALLRQLWAANGATEEQPHPFVRLMQSRVVSIAMMMRTKPSPAAPAELRLITLPRNPDDPATRDERAILSAFTTSVGRKQPQLIGFNSRASDLRIIAQRALALGIPAKGFLNRPAKPWEGVDYFARDNEASIDLMELIAGPFSSRAGAVSLHEAATLCGIPGKFDAHGDQVLDLWQAGHYREIVQYNAFDAITTYLLWLRLAWVSGRFSIDEYHEEEALLRDYLMSLLDQPDWAFLEAYLEEWDRLLAIKGE
ncbi:MAG: 3'-5' exonuclease [Candidatus Spyradenecus sp.]